MKYFALTARKGTDPERACALIDAPTIKDAALRAQRLKEEGFLSYVKHGSTYAIRPASRRETKLLQEFLNSCNRTEAKIHMQGDFDGLLARRQSLMMSFFMGLYLAPDKLKLKITGDSTPPSSTSPNAPSGSGGVQMDTSTIEAGGQEEAQVSSSHADSQTSSSNPKVESQEAEEAEGHADEPVGNDAQEDVLASILGSDEANDGGAGRDVDIDLGDDELL